MKKNLFTTLMLFVAMATLTLTSCSKDPEELILGDWNPEKAVVTVTYGGMPMSMDITKGIERFSFADNGILTWSMYEIEGVNEMMQPEFGTIVNTVNVNYVLDGDYLLLSEIDEMPMKFKLNVLEKDELSLESESMMIEEGMTMVIKMDFVK